MIKLFQQEVQDPIGNVILCGEASGAFLFESKIRKRYSESPILFFLILVITTYALSLKKKKEVGVRMGQKKHINFGYPQPYDYLPRKPKIINW